MDPLAGREAKTPLRAPGTLTNPNVGPRHRKAPLPRRPQTTFISSYQLVTRHGREFLRHLELDERLFWASLEIFILEGPLHDRYTRPLHSRGTVTPAILGRRPLGRLSFGALS